MVPGGSISAAALAAAISETREHLMRAGVPEAPFGVNLFVPRFANTAETPIADYAAHDRAVSTFRDATASLLELDTSELGVPVPDADEDWLAKLDLVVAERVPFVTFTFGLPRPQVFDRLRVAGISAGTMVTNGHDARAAAKAGAHAIIAQGVEAGGHRSTWRVAESPNDDDTLTVVASVRDALGHLGARAPVIIAAGGIDGAERVAAMRQAGAALVQVGTAVLLADEAGTKPTVRRALADPSLAGTIATRAYSGRVARAVCNRLAELLDPIAPQAYPDVNQITGPVRAAAEAAGDVHGVSAYAGVGWQRARQTRVAEILHGLVGG